MLSRSWACTFALPACLLLAGCVNGGERSAGCPENGLPLVVRGATVFEGTELQAVSRTVILRNGRISEVVSPAREPPTDPCARSLDAAGRYLVPGLWDLHVHVSKAGSELLAELPRLGITGVRDMGSSLAEINELQRRARSGLELLPHLSSPGPMFETAEVLERGSDGPTLEPREQTRQPIPHDQGELEGQLRSLQSQGASFAKLRSTSGPDEFRQFVAAAADLGIPVATHPPPLPPIELPAGVVTIEHGSYPYPLVGGEDSVEDVAAAFLEAGITIIPTLTAWKTQVMDVTELQPRMAEALADPVVAPLVPPRLAVEWAFDLSQREPRSEDGRRGWQEFYRQLLADLGALHESGVPLAAGSDIGVEGVVPGLALAQELCALEVELGMDPLDLLRMGSATAARIAGYAEITGSITPGMSADLLLLGEDPRASTRALASLQKVFLRGAEVQVTDDDRALLARACPE